MLVRCLRKCLVYLDAVFYPPHVWCQRKTCFGFLFGLLSTQLVCLFGFPCGFKSFCDILACEPTKQKLLKSFPKNFSSVAHFVSVVGKICDNTNLMDDNVKKRMHTDKGKLESGPEMEQDKGKKEKRKESKKKHGPNKTFNSNEVAEVIEGKKGRKDIEVIDSNVADVKEMQFLDENRKCKMKKRKGSDDSLAGMQEMSASKPSKKVKKTEDADFENRKGNPPLNEISTADVNAHSLANEDDCQGKITGKKKTLSNRSKVNGFKNEDDHSVVADERQGKKIEKARSKKKKRTEDEEYKSNEGNPHLAKRNVVDPPFVKSNEGDQHLVHPNGSDDDVHGKKMKRKKLGEKGKYKENNDFKSMEGDQHLAQSHEGEDDVKGKKMKMNLSDKSKSKENNEVEEQGEKTKKKKKAKEGTSETPNPSSGGTSKPKRVTFSDQVDICCDGLVRGKRFTPEEDDKIRKAVSDYIESHCLGNEGLDMILHCGSHPQVRKCWKEIGAALPMRPTSAVYFRAHNLFERSEMRTWTPEEVNFIKTAAEQHGHDWKSMSEALGRHRIHVKDTWRRIKLANTKKGRWSQEEYQTLFDLVNMDLRRRASEEIKKSKHGMLRDNIPWTSIGDELGTRSSSLCCQKWYGQLTSPLVANGEWSDTDDYRMINNLFTLDACSIEEVDWDNLLEHRSGNVCRKRWTQMVRCIGDHAQKSFSEQVEILAKRYCPDLLEVREAFDSKLVVC